MDDLTGLLDRLLYEKSSDVLIFRPQEYRFDGALILEKSQILKDILGAVNAWRRTDTYILIGVEETGSGQNRIMGIMNHLDGEKITDFVNSKLQKPIAFSYHALIKDRKKIGLIHIPLQDRPYFLKEDYANLKKYVIYIRRGGAVQEAGTDEVARIKESEKEPVAPVANFRVEFAHSGKREPLGEHLRLKTFLIDVPAPDALPDYVFPGDGQEEGEFFHCFPFQKINRDYYRQLAQHYRLIGGVGLLDFCVSNTGDETVRDVRLEISIEDPQKEYLCLEEFELPPRPEKNLGFSRSKPILVNYDENLRVRWKSPFWMIHLFFKEIPAHKTVFTSGGIYLGGKSGKGLDMVVMLESSELPQSLPFGLIIDIETRKRVLDKTVICK